jgi:hypothetical protein
VNIPEPIDFNTITKMILSLEENIKNSFPENSRTAWNPVVSNLIPPVADCLIKIKDAMQAHQNTLYEIIRQQQTLLAQQALTRTQT